MAGLLIVGTGPGIATSVARRFGTAGMPVALIARTQQSIEAARATLATSGVESIASATADASREADLKAALDTLVGRNGVPEVLVYNAGLIQPDRPGELSHERHVEAYAINVLGALTTVSHLAPRMAAEAGGGTVVITGGMPQAVSAYTSLSLGKAAVRALTSVLADEYGPAGVHVATVTVCDAVAPGGLYDPDTIAEHYWRLHQQPREQWEQEVVFAGEEPAHARR